jgi:hypothetical protein
MAPLPADAILARIINESKTDCKVTRSRSYWVRIIVRLETESPLDDYLWRHTMLRTFNDQLQGRRPGSRFMMSLEHGSWWAWSTVHSEPGSRSHAPATFYAYGPPRTSRICCLFLASSGLIELSLSNNEFVYTKPLEMRANGCANHVRFDTVPVHCPIVHWISTLWSNISIYLYHISFSYLGIQVGAFYTSHHVSAALPQTNWVLKDGNVLPSG